MRAGVFFKSAALLTQESLRLATDSPSLASDVLPELSLCSFLLHREPTAASGPAAAESPVSFDALAMAALLDTGCAGPRLAQSLASWQTSAAARIREAFVKLIPLLAARGGALASAAAPAGGAGAAGGGGGSARGGLPLAVRLSACGALLCLAGPSAAAGSRAVPDARCAAFLLEGSRLRDLVHESLHNPVVELANCGIGHCLQSVACELAGLLGKAAAAASSAIRGAGSAAGDNAAGLPRSLELLPPPAKRRRLSREERTREIRSVQQVKVAVAGEAEPVFLNVRTPTSAPPPRLLAGSSQYLGQTVCLRISESRHRSVPSAHLLTCPPRPPLSGSSGAAGSPRAAGSAASSSRRTAAAGSRLLTRWI